MPASASTTIYIDANEGKTYGACAAALLGHIRFWVQENEKNNRNFREGRYWTYDSFEALAGRLVMFSPHMVRRGIEKLLKLGVIVKGYFGAKWDRTSWYTLASEEYRVDDFEDEAAVAANESVKSEVIAADIEAHKDDAVTLPDLPEGCLWMRKQVNQNGTVLYRAGSLQRVAQTVSFGSEVEPSLARDWVAEPQFQARGAYFDLDAWREFEWVIMNSAQAPWDKLNAINAGVLDAIERGATKIK